ncbi:MAG: response regulator [Candidatus Cyclobacteriaceae bacterium M2_1C_046]
MSTGKTIFIIEKDEEMLSLLSLVLNKDYNLYLFEETDDVFFSQLEEKHPELLILDWYKNYLNTDEVINKIRDRHKYSGKILLTSTLKEVKEYAAEKEADAFLEKPFSIHELRNKISKLLNINVQQK